MRICKIKTMEPMNTKYELLTDAEVAEWNRLKLQAQIDKLEQRAAEYLANKKRK